VPTACAAEPEHGRVRALAAGEAARLEVQRELVRSALRPGVRLDVELVDPVPRGRRRAEDRRALGALDVHLHDHPRSLRERDRVRDDVRQRLDADALDADLVPGERIRGLERMTP
jgi:hypothetical protein